MDNNVFCKIYVFNFNINLHALNMFFLIVICTYLDLDDNDVSDDHTIDTSYKLASTQLLTLLYVLDSVVLTWMD